ncbi:MAG: 1-acyl-sn-glycerol-3-phosphate acyltransferase [Bacteroidales bacterium]|nr:1-acyl-sn-glycerol-3-phosphate acyltransferase [Bacteroidales bacterium]
MKKLWISIARLFGWRFIYPDENTVQRLRHCVLVEAPHTSIYDFLLGAASVWEMDLNGRFFIKKEFFVFPLRRFLRRCGAMPIDRGNRSNHMVEKAIETLNKENDITLIITPEGTRKKVKRWKRGFYEIALQANVPIAVTYINYRTKVMGVGPLIEPSGDFNADMLKILDFYDDVSPRNAEGWDLELLKSTYRKNKE